MKDIITLISTCVIFLPCVLTAIDNNFFLNEIKACQPEIAQDRSNVCLRKVMNTLLQENRKVDIPYLDLVVPDPLTIGNLPFIQNIGPLNIKSQFTDVNLNGLSNLTVFKVSNKYDKRTLTLHIRTETVLIDGMYTMNGNVLLLPIEGEGDFYVSAKNVVSIIHYTVIRNKDKPDYLAVSNLTANVAIEEADMQFLNLFKADPLLDETMHHFLNNNPEIFIDQITPFLNSKMGEILTEAFNNFFKNIPIKHLFPDGIVEIV